MARYALLLILPSLLIVSLSDRELLNLANLTAPLNLRRPGEPLPPAPADPKDMLNGFYRVYNAQLERAMRLKEQHEKLTTENASLEKLLLQYERATIVDAHTFDSPNSLMIINGRYDVS